MGPKMFCDHWNYICACVHEHNNKRATAYLSIIHCSRVLKCCQIGKRICWGCKRFQGTSSVCLISTCSNTDHVKHTQKKTSAQFKEQCELETSVVHLRTAACWLLNVLKACWYNKWCLNLKLLKTFFINLINWLIEIKYKY